MVEIVIKYTNYIRNEIKQNNGEMAVAKCATLIAVHCYNFKTENGK